MPPSEIPDPAVTPIVPVSLTRSPSNVMSSPAFNVCVPVPVVVTVRPSFTAMPPLTEEKSSASPVSKVRSVATVMESVARNVTSGRPSVPVPSRISSVPTFSTRTPLSLEISVRVRVRLPSLRKITPGIGVPPGPKGLSVTVVKMASSTLASRSIWPTLVICSDCA